MLKRLATLLIINLILISCKKEKSKIETCADCNFTCVDENDVDVITNNCLPNWECSFQIFENSTIDTEEYEGYTSGNKRIFQMIKHTNGSEQIADDEFTDIVIFELDKNQTSFSAEDADLRLMNAHFKTVCFCSDVWFKPIIKGCLQGEKQEDGTWFIQGNLTTINYNVEEWKIDAKFSS